MHPVECEKGKMSSNLPGGREIEWTLYYLIPLLHIHYPQYIIKWYFTYQNDHKYKTTIIFLKL